MATSAVPAFKAALVAALLAQYSAATVQVFYGPPGGPPATDDAVAVLGVEAEQEAMPMGTRARDERFSVVVVCSSYRGGGEEVQQLCTEAAYGLLATVESLLRTDPGVGATCRKAEVRAHVLTEEATEQGRLAEIAAVVDVLARI